MRGALGIDEPNAMIPGIIPADAGSTWRPLLKCDSRQDHPRGCGEHLGTHYASA